MLQLTETQQVTGSVQPVTKKGNAAQVQNPTFSSSDTAVLTVDSPDGLSFTAKAVAPGAVQLRWEGDADLGDGVRNITATADIVVVGGEAVSATIVFGTPTEQA